MKVLKIYTESKTDFNKNSLKIINNFYDGFTVNHSIGFWKGIQEKSIVIEVIQKNFDNNNIVKICNKIKKQNKQENVYFTIQKLEIAKLV